jgi:toxin-antitoxin system PIN domain toxin
VSRAALLDVNTLVALFDPDHVHHDLAHDWFADEGRRAWATCPVTENGFIRVLSNAAYGGAVARPSELAARLRRFCASGGHVFWEDSISLRDETLFDTALIAGHRQLTDIYLLGLAHARGGRLATFDRSIPLRAVRGATATDLAVIAPADRS